MIALLIFSAVLACAFILNVFSYVFAHARGPFAGLLSASLATCAWPEKADDLRSATFPAHLSAFVGLPDQS
jgi:hypothetical protein